MMSDVDSASGVRKHAPPPPMFLKEAKTIGASGRESRRYLTKWYTRTLGYARFSSEFFILLK
jgi:hypothetical protein